MKTIIFKFLDGNDCVFLIKMFRIILPESSLNEAMVWLHVTFLYSYPIKICRDSVLMPYVKQEVIISYLSLVFNYIFVYFYDFRSLRNMGCQLKRLQNFIRRAKRGE